MWAYPRASRWSAWVAPLQARLRLGTPLALRTVRRRVHLAGSLRKKVLV